jgi:hypothetical protein
LSSAELNEAKVHLQNQHFKEVKTAMNEKKRHNLVNQLGLQINDEGLVRCVCRLGAAQITEGARQPILLPKRDHVTDLLIDSLHRRYFYVGVSQTSSMIIWN